MTGLEFPMLKPFSVLDVIALAGFVGAWIVYAIIVEWTRHGQEGLNARMDRYREDWMRRMLAREMRMVDMQIMGSLQNGTAFFASTSLLAIGGALTLLRSTEELMPVVSALPFGLQASRELWEAKTIGPRRGLRLCLLQVRLGVSPVQLRGHPARSHAVRRRTRPRRKRRRT